MRAWIDEFATVSNAIAELIATRLSESSLGSYKFIERGNDLVDLKIETNAKVRIGEEGDTAGRMRPPHWLRN